PLWRDEQANGARSGIAPWDLLLAVVVLSDAINQFHNPCWTAMVHALARPSPNLGYRFSQALFSVGVDPLHHVAKEPEAEPFSVSHLDVKQCIHELAARVLTFVDQ